MSILDLARKVYAKIRVERNGPSAKSPFTFQGRAKSAKSAKREERPLSWPPMNEDELEEYLERIAICVEDGRQSEEDAAEIAWLQIKARRRALSSRTNLRRRTPTAQAISQRSPGAPDPSVRGQDAPKWARQPLNGPRTIPTPQNPTRLG
jgi:hypothetical protein